MSKKNSKKAMKKADVISAINHGIKSHNLDFDLVADDTKVPVKELNDLLADVLDAITEATAPPTITIAALSRELDKDAKTVRARLRRLYADKDKAKTLPQPIDSAKQRWTFPETAKEALTALIAD